MLGPGPPNKALKRTVLLSCRLHGMAMVVNTSRSARGVRSGGLYVGKRHAKATPFTLRKRILKWASHGRPLSLVVRRPVRQSNLDEEDV
jgi:hypothetical protein